MKTNWKLLLATAILFTFSVQTLSLQSQQAPGKDDGAKPKAEQEKAKEEKPKEAAKPPAGPPPEFVAFQTANRITDPQKKIEALEKILVDFPKAEAFVVTNVNQAILTTIVKAWPDQKGRILAQAQKIIGTPPDAHEKNGSYSSIAATLFNANILLEEAESFSRKGLEVFSDEKYLEGQKKFFKDVIKSPVTDEELQKNLRKAKASHWNLLGQIYLKRGKEAEGLKLLKDAYDVDPYNQGGNVKSASVVLAEQAEKSGIDKEAVEYLTSAAISGRMRKETRQKLEDLYRKSNHGSLDGLEELLDAKYKKAFATSLHVDDYQPTAARTKRVVLAEVFTGSGCPPCVAADLGFEAMMERYERDELVVMMYHAHIPAPDPMTNTATQDRFKFYGGGGVPTYVIDGHKDGGGGPREFTKQFYGKVNPRLEKRLEIEAEADLKVEAVLEGGIVKVKALLDNVKVQSENLKLHIVLVEDELRYSGENGIRFHPVVVRALGRPDVASATPVIDSKPVTPPLRTPSDPAAKPTDTATPPADTMIKPPAPVQGFKVDSSKATMIEQVFDLAKIVSDIKAHLDDFEVKRSTAENKFNFSEKKHEIDMNRLSVVAFVQDESNKKILQAAFVKVKPLGASRLTGKNEKQ